MDKEQALHDLAEREGICHFDGILDVREAKLIAREQVLSDLANDPPVDWKTLKAVREAQE